MLIESETLKAALIFNDKTGEITVPNMREVFRVIDSQPPFNPWHRVEERLPDDSRDVMIFTASRIVGVGSFIRPNWYQWYSGGGLPVDVTYWMPLPEPPKKGDTECQRT